MRVVRTRFLAPALVLLACAVPALRAEEGMWTLDNLPLAALQETYGFTPDAAWLAHAQRSAVRLAGGCSGSFVSSEGLVLTNYHCAIGCIQQLASAESDLLAGGFVAADRSQELRCPAMEINRLEEVTDVTDRIREATNGKEGEAYAEALQAAKATLQQECLGEAGESTRCDVVELYHGGIFQTYRYQRFQDVRLVFAPESPIGLFGGDPDNFEFPRYNLDMALLRVWDGAAPLAVDDFFRFQPAGAEAGELAMILGHPGTTRRLQTGAQLATFRDHGLMPNLIYLSELRGLLQRYATESEDAARNTQADLMGIENAIKVLRGQLATLVDPEVAARKAQEEQELRDFVAADPERQARYGSAWDEIAAAQEVARSTALERFLLSPARAFQSDYFGHAMTLVRGAAERAKPNAERLPEYTDAALPAREQGLLSPAPIHAEYETVKLGWSLGKLRELFGPDDAFVRQVLGRESPEAVAARWIDGTRLGDPELRRQLWEGGAEVVAASEDPFIVLVRSIDDRLRAVRQRHEEEVEAVETRNAQRIAQARFERYGTSIYPDATFSLRLSYGRITGWTERGEEVMPFTELAGLYERATGEPPYVLTRPWLDARERVDLAARVNFVTTNDIIGGNSGSPVINREGEVIGLVFDGNRHSIGGAYWYDPELNRAVAVHPAFMLEALEEVYGAPHLARELSAAAAAAEEEGERQAAGM